MASSMDKGKECSVGVCLCLVAPYSVERARGARQARVGEARGSRGKVKEMGWQEGRGKIRETRTGVWAGAR